MIFSLAQQWFGIVGLLLGLFDLWVILLHHIQSLTNVNVATNQCMQ
jgi:hypothetical protein